MDSCNHVREERYTYNAVHYVYSNCIAEIHVGLHEPCKGECSTAMQLLCWKLLSNWPV